MNRRVALIGLVVFIAGIALLGVGAYGVESSLHTVGAFTLLSPGEYVTPKIHLTSEATVTLRSAPSSMGLVTAANLSLVNATNLASMEVPITTSSSGTSAYVVPAGDYYVVAFASSAPGTTVQYLYTSEVAGYGIATLLGLILALGGGITGLVGLVRKRKPPAGPAPVPWGGPSTTQPPTAPQGPPPRSP